MIRDVPNFTEKSLKENNFFKDFAQKALIKLFDVGTEVIEDNNELIIKLFKNNNISYLVVKNKEISSLSVYSEKSDYAHNFTKYIIPNLKKGQQFEENPILSVNYNINYLNKPSEKENKNYEKQILNYLSKYFPDPKYQEYYYDQLDKKNQLIDPFKAVISPYLLKQFFNFMYQEKAINKPLTDNDWLAHLGHSLNEYMNQYTDSFDLDLNMFFTACHKHKFNKENYYELHNSAMYVNEHNALIISNNNFTTYTLKNNDNYTVYMCNDEEEYTKFQSIKEIEEHIAKNDISLIDNVLLKVENNEVIYANNALLNSFELDLHFAKEDLIENKLGKIIYPVDITDYDYQIAYYQNKFGITEFTFLTSVFLMDSFEYNQKKGIFSSYLVHYDSKVLKQEKLPEPEKIVNLIYHQETHKNYPVLNEKWKNGLEYLIEKLTTDRPLPENGTLIEKNKILDDSISYLQNLHNNLKVIETKLPKKKKIV